MSSLREDLDAPVEGSWILDAAGRTTAVSAATAALLGYAPAEMRGRPPAEFVADEDAQRLEDALARRRDGCRECYEIRWRTRGGDNVWAQVTSAPIRDPDGSYAGAFALVTDVSDRHHTDARAERQARQQEAVARLGRRALERADVASLFDDAARTAAEVLQADWGGVMEYTGDRLRLVAAHGMPAGAVRDLQATRDEAMPSLYDMAPTDALIVPDWELEPRLEPPSWAVELGVRSSAALPIAGLEIHGVLAAGRREPWTPADDEIRFLQALANVLAAALEREAVEDDRRRHALHDELTGLPNRTLALDRLDQALRRAPAGTLAAIAVDLDRFKRVNDSFGVATGDELVRRVGAELRRLARPGDTVARLGGGTFAVIAAEVTGDEAAALAGRIVEQLRFPVGNQAGDLDITVSAGVAISDEGDEAGHLLRDAEAALDRAKAHGRDRFELFDPDLRARAVDRVQLERDLRRAAARGELFVAYQPIVSVGSGRVTGTEALVRWRHPERGVVPPGDFIGIAEESGLIGEIGSWVLRRACTDVAERHRAGHAITCHVNLAPRQASDPELPDLVAEVLEATGLPPESLVLELTEGSLMEAGEGPQQVMQALRALGVRIVLDDFGTGYSSLSRLRRFPIDGLKIDRSFVNDLDGSEPADALLVAGIVELARALGLTVVAEGVETDAQLRRLRRLGCRYAQGFLLARPADTAELDRLLASASLLPGSG